MFTNTLEIVSLIIKAKYKMKYNTLNFKLFIYLLLCKMWSSLMRLWLLLWSKDTLLYSKQVLHIKLFFLVSKSFPVQNVEMEFMIFLPNSVLFQCSYWC